MNASNAIWTISVFHSVGRPRPCLCPPRFFPSNPLRSCYYFGTGVSSWHGKKARCAGLGAYLVEIKSLEEAWFIASTYGKLLYNH